MQTRFRDRDDNDASFFDSAFGVGMDVLNLDHPSTFDSNVDPFDGRTSHPIERLSEVPNSGVSAQ